MKIKLCGVRTVDDALLCAEAGADEIGVIFAAKSKRRVTLETARAIREALPPAVPVVGVFMDQPIDEVMRTVFEAGLQAAQLHGAWPGGDADLPLYAALQVTGEDALQARAGASRILLDGPAGGSGISFAWSLAQKARGMFPGVPIFVSGGLTAENVAQAISEARPSGVDVASGIENASGYKDAQRVRAFMRAARGADFK